jgi:hypothetical protein
VSALSDIRQFLASLGEGYQFAYRLQVLAQNSTKPEIAAKLKECDYRILLDHIFRSDSAFKGLRQIAEILHTIFSPPIASLAPELVPKLLKLFPNARHGQVAISTLLCDFIAESAESVSEIVSANEALLEAAIGGCLFAEAFGHFVSAIIYLPRVVELCLKHLGDKVTKNHFLEVLEWIVRLSDNADLEFVLLKCIDFLPNLTGSSFASIVRTIGVLFSRYPDSPHISSLVETLFPNAFTKGDKEIRLGIAGFFKAAACVVQEYLIPRLQRFVGVFLLNLSGILFLRSSTFLVLLNCV